MGISMLRFAPMYAGLLGILLIVLAYRVTMFRRKEKAGIEQQNCSTEMKCAIRAHANAVENIPIALILLVMLELNHLNPILLNVFGSVFVLARVMHAYGISGNSAYSFGRFYGTLFSWLVVLSMAALNIYLAAFNTYSSFI